MQNYNSPQDAENKGRARCLCQPSVSFPHGLYLTHDSLTYRPSEDASVNLYIKYSLRFFFIFQVEIPIKVQKFFSHNLMDNPTYSAFETASFKEPQTLFYHYQRRCGSNSLSEIRGKVTFVSKSCKWIQKMKNGYSSGC